MRAIAVTPSSKAVSLIDMAEPKLSSPTDVKLRMVEAGVCGTDREICSFEYGTPPSGMADLVIGHESLGEVVEVGANVTRVKVGDLVVPMVRRPCPHDYCMACRASRQDFCFTGDFTERGIKEQHGFMAQFVVDDEKFMNLVPSGSARHRRSRRAAHHRGKRFGPGLEHPATVALGVLCGAGQSPGSLP